MAEEQDFRKGKLPGKFTAKMLYRQDNGKFEKKYLRKLERNQNKWKKDKRVCEVGKVKKKDANEYMRELEGIVWT